MSEISGISQVVEQHNGRVLVLYLKGRLYSITSMAVEKKIFEYIHKGNQNILLNFAEVNYLSSTGLRMLISPTKKLSSLAGHIVLCSLVPSVLYVLEISGVDKRIDISSTEDEGLHKF
jgi:anti-anti-sigma factor